MEDREEGKEKQKNRRKKKKDRHSGKEEQNFETLRSEFGNGGGTGRDNSKVGVCYCPLLI